MPFIEARPHRHNQHVIRNLEWGEWKLTCTKISRTRDGQVTVVEFLFCARFKKKQVFCFQINIPNNTHTYLYIYIYNRISGIMTRIDG